MGGRIAQLSLFAVALIIGLLLVAQLRSQARPLELSALSAQELSELVQTLSARNVELNDGLADMREQIRTYEVAEAEGKSNLDLAREDLARIRAFGGLGAVEGQGLIVSIDGAYDATHINDLVHELRNAGADAIAVDDVRITAASVAVMGSGAVEIDGVALGRTVEIRAIGPLEGLPNALDRPGGILTLLRQSTDAQFSLRPQQFLEVPATRRDLAPRAGRPVE